MSLLDRNGDKADAWRRADVPGAQTQVIVPLADLVTTLASGNQIVGVEIANTSRVDELAPHFDRLGLIAIAFPSFSDGRGFSIARTLRNAGYKGVLRAVGPLIADQFAYALACGFDEVELPANVAGRAPTAQYLAAANAIHATYQRGYSAAGQSILERRRAAQGGKS